MMGAALAKAAYAVSAALEIREHAQVRLFVFMALTALDSDPLPVYFGGRKALAEAMSLEPTTNGFRSVERAMSGLARRGLIAVVSKGAPGRSAHYGLLDGSGSPLDNARRLAPGEWTTADAQRRVNKSQRPTPDHATPDAERPQHPTLSYTQRKKEDKEEEGRASATPTRSCRIHSIWEHSKPCRACANDRRAAEAAPDSRRDSTMSPRVLDCGTGNHRRLNDGTCMICENIDPLWEVA